MDSNAIVIRRLVFQCLVCISKQASFLARVSASDTIPLYRRKVAGLCALDVDVVVVDGRRLGRRRRLRVLLQQFNGDIGIRTRERGVARGSVRHNAPHPVAGERAKEMAIHTRAIVSYQNY